MLVQPIMLVAAVCCVRAKRPRRDMPMGDLYVSMKQDDPIWTSIRYMVDFSLIESVVFSKSSFLILSVHKLALTKTEQHSRLAVLGVMCC